MNRFLLFFLGLIAIAFFSQAQTFVPDHNHNLVVVYFTPSDVQPMDGWEARNSSAIIYGQNWFRDKMHDLGYDDVNGQGKTFGLVKDNAQQLVQIVRIVGPQNAAFYQASANGRITDAVNAFFAENATNAALKTSEHVLIIYHGITNGPFNGFGKYCLVPDVSTRTGPGAAGMFHEMGHAFGLPHDHATKSVFQGTPSRQSIMGGGRHIQFSHGLFNPCRLFYIRC